MASEERADGRWKMEAKVAFSADQIHGAAERLASGRESEVSDTIRSTEKAENDVVKMIGTVVLLRRPRR